MIMNIKKNNNFLQQLIKAEPTAFTLLKVGDIVPAVFLEKKSRMLIFDLGKYGTGVIYWNEIQNAKEIIKKLKLGAVVHAKVIAADNEEGFVELSLIEAGKQKLWAGISELYEKEEIVVVKPAAFNRGGLVAELNGLQAFLPISQLSNEHYPKVSVDEKNQITEALQKLIGEEIKVKIIDVNPRTNKLIVSEKAAREENMKELAKGYEVGQVIEGIISGVADFGAFVKFTDNPAVEGLIHVSELDWRNVENSKEIVKVDDAVKAKIIEIRDGKIFLSRKALLPDPWQAVKDKYKEGDEVSGKIYSFNPFGAIIDLANSIQGQLHVAEFGGLEEMKRVLSLGGVYPFFIESINLEERRIILKAKK